MNQFVRRGVFVGVGLAACLSWSATAGAQQWQILYGSEQDEFGRWIRPAPDGGFVIAGTRSIAKQDTDIVLVKTDADGNVVWDIEADFTILDRGYRVEPLADGSGYLLAGEQDDPAAGTVLMLFGTGGSFVWAVEAASSPFAAAENLGPAVAHVPDDGWLVATRSFGLGGLALAPVLHRINRDGTFRWSRYYVDDRFGTDTFADFLDVERVPDGFVVCGQTSDATVGDNDTLVMRIDDAGAVLWARSYQIPGDDEEIARGIETLPMGELLVTGRQNRTGVGETYLLKTDGGGFRIFYEEIEGFVGTNALELAAGALVGLPGTLSTRSDAILCVADVTTGMFSFGVAYDVGGAFDAAYGITPVPGGFHLVGEAASGGFLGSDIYSVLTDAAGVSGCNEAVESLVFRSAAPAARNLEITPVDTFGGAFIEPSITSRTGIDVLCSTTGCDVVLTIAGPCPASVTFDVAGLTPGGDFALLYSVAGTGSTTIPRGFICAGTELGLRSPVNVGLTDAADAAGDYTTTVTVAGAACGFIPVQAIDLETCCTSDVVFIP